MDFSNKRSPNILKDILSDDEVMGISEETQGKLNEFFCHKLEEFITFKAIFETAKDNHEKKLKTLETEIKVQRLEFDSTQKKYEKSMELVTGLKNNLSHADADINKLTETIKRMDADNIELKMQKQTITDERDVLKLQIERRNAEIASLHSELSTLVNQLHAAVGAKYRALSDIDEIRSRDMSLAFKERKLDQERMLLNQQLAGIEDELSKRTMELQTTRAQASTRALLTNTRLSECEEELRIANETACNVREINSHLQNRVEELSQKLEEQRNHELTMHSSYREEVGAQTRLVELYKGMAEEANSKADEYATAVKQLQSLLEQATEQFGALESKYNQTLFEHAQEMSIKHQEIDEFTKKLAHSTELLIKIKQEKLDLAVEQLAPTAAIASRVLKKGLSLTQIYTQFIELSNDLAVEKEENEKLKSHMEIILRELEEKAPILVQQRENVEAANTNIISLTIQLDEILLQNNQLKEESDAANRVANIHSRENQRLKNEMADLARQVCYLLKEVQEIRLGGLCIESSANQIDELPSSQIISKHLVTFRDIEELQNTNQKLLSIVRSLSARQEEIESTSEQINSGEMRDKLDRYIEQLAEMQASQDRQAQMLEGLLTQRDKYKTMYHRCLEHLRTSDDMNDSSNPRETLTDVDILEIDRIIELKNIWNKKIENSEYRLKELTTEFESYKNEKVARENIMTTEIERLRTEATINSTQLCRLKAELDSTNERFHLLQANEVSYKSQIKSLEEKCNSYSLTVGKHEQSLMLLKDEALSARSHLSRAEVKLENMRYESQLLRNSEDRLLKEREIFQRERQTQTMLKADVESIKTSLERIQEESQIREEQRYDDAVRECAALRRRLQDEQDHFRERVTNLEHDLKMAEEKLSYEINLSNKLRMEFDSICSTHSECSTKIQKLTDQLEQNNVNTTTKHTSGSDDLKAKVKDLDAQLISAQIEVKSLHDQLRLSRRQCEQYCNIAESAESHVKEITSQYSKANEELKISLNHAGDEVISLQEKVKLLNNRLQQTDNHPIIDSELKHQLTTAENQLKELTEVKDDFKVLQKEMQNITMSAALTEEKYAREMALHSADLQVLVKLKEESVRTNEKIDMLMRERDLAKENLDTTVSAWKTREKHLLDEISEFQTRIEDLDSQNVLLHSQIQGISDRASLIYCRPGTSCDKESPDLPTEAISRTHAEEDSNSAEQLLRVMKYLRREKDLTMAKFDVLRHENLRLKSQINVLENRLSETTGLLNTEREKSEIKVITASKHAELLRKVETLNAITDSNRILREERDALNGRIQELSFRISSLTEEVMPLREKSADLEVKYDSLLQENLSLKAEATRWRQRANVLVEKTNKASPEDWRRLQTERENLSKLLTSEREIHAKHCEEFEVLKNDKTKLDNLLLQMQKEEESRSELLLRHSEEVHKLRQDLNLSQEDSNAMAKDLISLKKEVCEKDIALTDIKNKEIQIRKIAKKYKTQYEDLAKSVEEEKSRPDEMSLSINEERIQDRAEYYREEGRQVMRHENIELTRKIDDLTRQVDTLQTEVEKHKREIDSMNKTSIEKEERAKQVLKGARTKIMQLTEIKKNREKELMELKAKIDANEQHSDSSDLDTKLSAIKSQMEGRISRIEHERTELQAEKESLLQRVSQLQRQLSGISGINAITEPPTANIKPMAARTETPLASIRPMSVVVQSRTVAVMPTTAPVLVVPQQQQVVHTTETSSPTSSHTDYQPASTSCSNVVSPGNIRQLAVQPHLNESAESTQKEDSENNGTMLSQPQGLQQQAVALVSPRVEQQPNIIDQLTVASSSSQSVSTSQVCSGHKRPRTLDATLLGADISEGSEHARQEQESSPKSKRTRQLELIPSKAATSDVEYQVPTSSQRDQDEDGDDGCIVVVDCDEGEGSGNNPGQEEEDFDNDQYEEAEEEDELPYSAEDDGVNNEVEIIIDERSRTLQIARQPQIVITANQQQSETISSAGASGDPSSYSRTSRSIAPMQRQHLLLSQQGFEENVDDGIVPSTPTLFIPRRGDGFNDGVSSPQVPQSRFNFGDPSLAILTSSVPPQAMHSNPTMRTMFGSSSSGIAQVVQEGMDDTRMDLSQLGETEDVHNEDTILMQISPTSDHAQTASVIESCEEQSIMQNTNDLDKMTKDCSTESQPENISNIQEGSSLNQDNAEVEKKTTEETESIEPEQNNSPVEAIVSHTNETLNEGETDNSRIDENEAEASLSTNIHQRTIIASTTAVLSTPLSSVRSGSTRRSARSSFRITRGIRPTPIIWENESTTRSHQVSMRGHLTRGANSEMPRGRSLRGRRMRSKYPYTY